MLLLELWRTFSSVQMCVCKRERAFVCMHAQMGVYIVSKLCVCVVRERERMCVYACQVCTLQVRCVCERERESMHIHAWVGVHITLWVMCLCVLACVPVRMAILLQYELFPLFSLDIQAKKASFPVYMCVCILFMTLVRNNVTDFFCQFFSSALMILNIWNHSVSHTSSVHIHAKRQHKKKLD